MKKMITYEEIYQLIVKGYKNKHNEHIKEDVIDLARNDPFVKSMIEEISEIINDEDSIIDIVQLENLYTASSYQGKIN